MKNILLFIGTVVLYTAIWIGVTAGHSEVGVYYIAWRAALFALLCLPFNINGNVWTVIGNAVGEKNVYSLLSLYQKAGSNAVNILGLLGYQKAGGDALTMFGLSGYQKAVISAHVPVGLAFYQEVGGTVRTFGAFFALFKE